MAQPSASAASLVVSVVGPQYAAPRVVALTIDEESFSATGGDYTVTNAANGTTVFFVKGKVLNLYKHRTLTDIGGNAIVTMLGSIATLHNRWSVYRGLSEDNRDLLFTVRQASMIQVFNLELHVFLRGNDGEDDWDFLVKGSVKSCTISERRTGSVIARMHAKNKLSNLIGKDLFEVTIEPNVDQAFVTALIVLLDEIHEAFGVMDAGSLIV